MVIYIIWNQFILVGIIKNFMHSHNVCKRKVCVSTWQSIWYFFKLKLFIKQAKNEFQCLNSNNLDVQTLDEQGGISMEVFRWL